MLALQNVFLDLAWSCRRYLWPYCTRYQLDDDDTDGCGGNDHDHDSDNYLCGCYILVMMVGMVMVIVMLLMIVIVMILAVMTVTKFLLDMMVKMVSFYFVIAVRMAMMCTLEYLAD